MYDTYLLTLLGQGIARRAHLSPSFSWYQIILLGDKRQQGVRNLPKVSMPSNKLNLYHHEYTIFEATTIWGYMNLIIIIIISLTPYSLCHHVTQFM